MKNDTTAKAAGKGIPRPKSEVRTPKKRRLNDLAAKDAAWLQKFVQHSLAGPVGHLHYLRQFAEKVLLADKPGHGVENHVGEQITEEQAEYQSRALERAVILLSAAHTIWNGLVEFHPTLHWSDGFAAARVLYLFDYLESEAIDFQNYFTKGRGFDAGYNEEQQILADVAAGKHGLATVEPEGDQ